MKIRAPQTEREWADYFELRWRVLRAPWNKPRGSERDELEQLSTHFAAFAGDQLIGVIRLHAVDKETGQMRYLAVLPRFQNRGIGAALLTEVESACLAAGLHRLIMNARNPQVPWYLKKGYRWVEPAHTLYGRIPHSRLEKTWQS